MAAPQRVPGRRVNYQLRYKPRRRQHRTVGDNLTYRTPRKIKPKSNPQAGKPTIHPYTDPLIDNELEGANLFDRPAEPLILSIFPNEKLPCGVGTMLSYMSLNLNVQSYQYKKIVVNEVETGESSWAFLPRMTDSSYAPGVKETEFAFFMTGIANSCLSYPFKAFCDFSVQRLFTGAFATRPLKHTDSGLQRKPDILGANAALLAGVLSRLQDGDTFTWPNVDIVIEIRSVWTESVLKDVMHNDVANKIIAIFDQQPNRSFVPSLAIAGYEAYFSVWNRAGVVHSERFNINKRPDLFLRVMMGFLFAKDADIGYDQTMTVDQNGNYHIHANGKDYIFVERLFSSQMIHGRGTWCWIVREVGAKIPKYLVVKDSWPLKGRWPDEVCHFTKIKKKGGIKGVCTMEFYDDVELRPGVPDETDAHRGVYEGLPNCFHRRIFFQEIGEPIYMFRTKRELIKAFIDYVSAHYDLYFEADILHGDISLYNLLLRKRMREFLNNLSEEDRKGLLVDLDYAYDRLIGRAERKGPRGEKTGTPPFMSVGVLLNDEAEHTIKDDLESFFYVLVYMCGMYSGPLGQEITGDCPHYLHQWIYTDDFDDLGLAKNAQLFLPTVLWKKKVSNDFQPYWNCLKPCILQLRKLVRRKSPTHEEFIKILKETLKTMPVDDNATPEEDSSDGGEDTDIPDSDIETDDNDDEGYQSPTSFVTHGSRKRHLPAADFVHTSSTLKKVRLVQSEAPNNAAAIIRKKKRRID